MDRCSVHPRPGSASGFRPASSRATERTSVSLNVLCWAGELATLIVRLLLLAPGPPGPHGCTLSRCTCRAWTASDSVGCVRKGLTVVEQFLEHLAHQGYAGDDELGLGVEAVFLQL